MTATSNPDFNSQTEGVEVAKAFSGAIRGKTVLVTGVNRGGIGFSTAEAFASQSPAHIIITGRNPSKIQESIDALKERFPDVHYRPLQLDLSSQRSVRAAAAEFLLWSDVPTVDIIVNNAGVMAIPERTITEDGVELHLATNHIGHFLFTCLISPKLIKAAQGAVKGATRVINVASNNPQKTGIRWSDLTFEKRNRDLPESEQPDYDSHRLWGETDPEEKAYLPIEGYNQSKAANVLFSIALNKRLYDKHGILSLAVHPGVIMTELGRAFPPEAVAVIQKRMVTEGITFQGPGVGASTSLVAALDPKLSVSETKDGNENHGIYLEACQISHGITPLALSSDEAEKLWRLSEDLVKEKFAW